MNRQNLTGTRGLRNQRGVVMLIALIVLVAMTLAGVAMVRSMDTTMGIAGNMAFKQSAIQGSDIGVNTAFTWLAANSAGTTLQNSNSNVGYFSARPATEPDWFNEASWGNAFKVNNLEPDAAGNRVRYIIHRMCTQPNLPYNGTGNECALYYPLGGAASGGSMSVGAFQFEGIPQLFYRVTTRVDGPRNTVSIIQVSVMIQV
jgi:type IV pilus assembly protein PilX